MSKLSTIIIEDHETGATCSLIVKRVMGDMLSFTWDIPEDFSEDTTAANLAQMINNLLEEVSGDNSPSLN
jgi:hypothetical protein